MVCWEKTERDKAMKLIIASNNAHKLTEIKAILGNHFEEILSMREAGIEHETVEDGNTFLENARKKAREMAEISGCCALADDSGICVDALDGAPGIYSARYGFDESLNDRGRLELLLSNMQQVPDCSRQAKFVCVITMVTPDGQVVQARGEAHGKILRSAAGEGGFGYDPVFYYPPLGKTFAELSAEEKNQVSHRAEALKSFYKKLVEAGYADK